jgi:integrase
VKIAEAKKFAYEWEKSVKGGTYSDTSISCIKLFEEWDKNHLSNLAPRTRYENRQLWKKAAPHIGHIKTDKINNRLITAMYRQLSETGSASGGPYDISGLHRVLSSMFNWGIKKYYLTVNPCENVDKPKKPQKEEQFALDISEVATLLENLSSQSLQLQCQVALLVTIGCRRGELVALRWSDIKSNGKIVVERAVAYVPKEGLHVKLTKAEDIRRTRLPEFVLELLTSWKNEQSRMIAKLGDRYTDMDYIFSQRNGNHKHPDSIRKPFMQYIESCGFPPEMCAKIHPHTMRHSLASALIEYGADVQTVAGILGHSSAATTLKYYSHFLESQSNAVADLFNPLFDKLSKPQTPQTDEKD